MQIRREHRYVYVICLIYRKRTCVYDVSTMYDMCITIFIILVNIKICANTQRTQTCVCYLFTMYDTCITMCIIRVITLISADTIRTRSASVTTGSYMWWLRLVVVTIIRLL